jgi:hypothetical protein
MRNTLRVPWKGTLSLHPRVQQKLIKIVSSAAVCGLSFSFIIGEAVDQKAQFLGVWNVDANFIPLNYAPQFPLMQAYSQIELTKAKEQWVAINSLGTKELPEPATMPAFQDSLKTILASSSKQEEQNLPAQIIDKKVETKIVQSVSLEPTKNASNGDQVIMGESASTDQQAQNILASIQRTTTKFADKEVAENSSVITSGNIVVKMLPDEEESIPKSNEQIILGNNDYGPKEPPQKPRTEPDRLVASAVNPAQEEKKDWIIQGRVLGSQKREKGHFEIGLFSRIDQDGLPVGNLVAQKILPAGITEFQIKVPRNIEKVFLFGEYITSKNGKRSWLTGFQNPWTRNMNQLAELKLRTTDSVSSVAAATLSNSEAGMLRISGSVSTLFVKEGNIPQEDVVVKIRGRKEASRTDRNGNFSLDIPSVNGTVFLEFLKNGYHPSLYSFNSSEGATGIRVQLASRDAVEQMARRMGLRQLGSKGAFVGKVLQAGKIIRGATVQTNLKAEGPYYFNEDGIITSDLKNTTSDGRFIYFNLDPGSGYMEVATAGDPVSPFSLSIVEGGEMVSKDLQIVSGSLKGRIFNPVDGSGKLLPIAGARIKIEGSSDWINTDSYGAFSLGPLKWIKGESVSLEFSSEKYNNHKYLIQPKAQSAGLNLYAFPANYLGRLAQSMDVDLDSSAGIVMGKVSNLSVRIDALADHSAVNSAKDFYFDSKGKLRGSHTMTDSRYGTYTIFNVPKGRALLQGNDSQGILRYSEAIISNGATISVIMD